MKRILIAAALLTCAATSTAANAAQTLTTTFSSNNSQNGNIFNVSTGANALTLQSLGLNISGSAGANAGLEFYYRPGSSVGFQDTQSGWTLFSSNSVVSAGSGLPTFVDIADFVLNANSTYGFYFTRNDGGLLNYTNGTGIGSVAASNADLTVYQGYGEAYRNSLSFAPRTVNATFNYTLGAVSGAVPEPSAWFLMIAGFAFIGGTLRRRRNSERNEASYA